MILAGDIGGTNTRLAYFDIENGRLRMLLERSYPSQGHNGLQEIVSAFLSNQAMRVEAACFGVAGPVLHGRVNASNLAWTVDPQEMARFLGLKTVWLINDLEAHAYSLDQLMPEDFLEMNPAAEQVAGNAAMIAAGTGLGEIGLYWDGTHLRPFASEGGHGDFAARTDDEIELLKWLRAKFQRVSYERVLSGPGLANVYHFLRETGREEEPAWLAEELAGAADPSEAISRHALESKSPLCERALRMFVEVMGAEAGNLGLRYTAMGGVYIGGGIAPKIRPMLMQPNFMEAFGAKGRLSPMLKMIPVRLVMNPRTGLIGAARCAVLHAALHPGA